MPQALTEGFRTGVDIGPYKKNVNTGRDFLPKKSLYI